MQTTVGILRDLCTTGCGDGVMFDVESLTYTRTWEEMEDPGVKVVLHYCVRNAVCLCSAHPVHCVTVPAAACVDPAEARPTTPPWGSDGVFFSNTPPPTHVQRMPCPMNTSLRNVAFGT